MSVLTIQPSDADTFLNSNIPDTNYGSETYAYAAWAGSGGTTQYRGIWRFDFSALPVGATITNATLSLYVYNGDTTATVDCCRLTQTGWVEGEATWNVYGTGTNWVSAGGDYTETDKAQAAGVASENWLEFDVTTLVQYFQANDSEIANFITKFNNESPAADRRQIANSSEAGSNTPKLVITYTGGPNEYTLTADVGSFVLTGVDTIFNKAISMTASAGSFVLTGVAASFSKAISMACSVGSFILTGIDVALSRTGIQWDNTERSSAISPSNVSKNSISPTNRTKNNTTFSNQSQS